MSSNQVAERAAQAVQTNPLVIAAFVLSLMGMYGSPALSGVLALVGLRQVKKRGQNGSGLAIAALAVVAAVTALHVVMWIHCGRANFELLTTAHW
ncbi:DUF4190 domain-containing protein [Mycobacterium sp.]|uniref:DUF4190 domain-containing protein n=1 Tax=Mycobacterium sp. TaxID=1785 RepID=UPI0025F1FFD9|nr:DUF4190 domain-containing protein [Mycobacterium sp.]MBW0011806.1 DUF4190 domain-containing protein [Mycobacterium sp.]